MLLGGSCISICSRCLSTGTEMPTLNKHRMWSEEILSSSAHRCSLGLEMEKQ